MFFSTLTLLIFSGASEANLNNLSKECNDNLARLIGAIGRQYNVPLVKFPPEPYPKGLKAYLKPRVFSSSKQQVLVPQYSVVEEGLPRVKYDECLGGGIIDPVKTENSLNYLKIDITEVGKGKKKKIQLRVTGCAAFSVETPKKKETWGYAYEKGAAQISGEYRSPKFKEYTVTLDASNGCNAESVSSLYERQELKSAGDLSVSTPRVNCPPLKSPVSSPCNQDDFDARRECIFQGYDKLFTANKGMRHCEILSNLPELPIKDSISAQEKEAAPQTTVGEGLR